MRDDSLANILADYNKTLSQNRNLDQDVARINDKIDKRINVCDDTNQILDNATKEFKHLTSILNKKDLPFLYSLFYFNVESSIILKFCVK